MKIWIFSINGGFGRVSAPFFGAKGFLSALSATGLGVPGIRFLVDGIPVTGGCGMSARFCGRGRLTRAGIGPFRGAAMPAGCIIGASRIAGGIGISEGGDRRIAGII